MKVIFSTFKIVDISIHFEWEPFSASAFSTLKIADISILKAQTLNLFKTEKNLIKVVYYGKRTKQIYSFKKEKL